MLYFLMKRPDWVWDITEKRATEDGYEYEYYIDTYNGEDDDILGYTDDFSVSEQYRLKYLNDKFIYVTSEDKCGFDLKDIELEDVDKLKDLGIKVVYYYKFRIRCMDISNSKEPAYVSLYRENFLPGVPVGDAHEDTSNGSVFFIVKNSFVSHGNLFDGNYVLDADVIFVSPKVYDSVTIWEADDIKPFLDKCDNFIMKHRGLYENFN